MKNNNYYVEKADLANWVREYQSTGIARPELIKCVQQIAVGLHGRYKFPVPREEFIQESYLLFFKKAHKIDPNKGVFCWITTCLFNAFRQMYRTDQNENVKRARYRAKQLEELPGKVRRGENVNMINPTDERHRSRR